ncbi:hypothetical protein FHS88_001635 [Roseomonas alkaliterrae]|uniref:UrcA family protein n=2 Tax=Neoroseomonas alkaliterrae TaxID=1452450 RepID=A0A840XRH1_9PROT|nr:hypothetical protein [Neoroseomonas alkaliterrae]MBB5689510.1 hypothetical protein [Neoroseomonas alkaliterrae]
MRIALLAALILTTPPLARACDSEAMSAELTAVCTAALHPSAEAARAVRDAASAAEAAALDRALARATEACATGDPAIGAAEAARIARLAGRIEARAGIADPIWPDRLATR